MPYLPEFQCCYPLDIESSLRDRKEAELYYRQINTFLDFNGFS